MQKDADENSLISPKKYIELIFKSQLLFMGFRNKLPKIKSKYILLCDISYNTHIRHFLNMRYEPHHIKPASGGQGEDFNDYHRSCQ